MAKFSDEKDEIINKTINYVNYLTLKCKDRLNSGHLRKLRKLLQEGEEK